MGGKGLEIVDLTVQRFSEKRKREAEREARRYKIRAEEKDALYRRLTEEESKLLSKKEDYRKEILSWRDDFVNTPQFERVFSIVGERIKIFRGGWGHKIPYIKEEDCWSTLWLEEIGDLMYNAGFKGYMGMSRRSYGPIYNFEEDFEKFSPQYLKEICDAINGGVVYRSIASTLELFLKFKNSSPSTSGSWE